MLEQLNQKLAAHCKHKNRQARIKSMIHSSGETVYEMIISENGKDICSTHNVYDAEAITAMVNDMLHNEN